MSLVVGGCRPKGTVEAGTTAARPVIDTAGAVTFAAPDSVGGFSQAIGPALRLRDRSVVVSDYGAGRLLWFDPTGRFIRFLGRQGSGPGEFQRPRLIQVLRGDTLLVWDQVARRLTWMDPRSGGSRELMIPNASTAQRFEVIGQLEAGQLVLLEYRPPAELTPSAREQVTVVLRDPATAEEGKALADFSGGPFGGFYFFAPRVSAATNGQRIVAGEGSRWVVAAWEGNSGTRSEMRRDWTPAQAPESAKARMRALYAAHNAAPELTADDKFLPTVPAFGEILLGSDGSTWVKNYRLPFDAPDSVSVFDREGRFVTALALPPGFSPVDVGPDHILGATRDTDDVVRFVDYKLGWTH